MRSTFSLFRQEEQQSFLGRSLVGPRCRKVRSTREKVIRRPRKRRESEPKGRFKFFTHSPATLQIMKSDEWGIGDDERRKLKSLGFEIRLSYQQKICVPQFERRRSINRFQRVGCT